MERQANVVTFRAVRSVARRPSLNTFKSCTRLCLSSDNAHRVHSSEFRLHSLCHCLRRLGRMSLRWIFQLSTLTKRFANETISPVARRVVPTAVNMWPKHEALRASSGTVRLASFPIGIRHRIDMPLISRCLYSPDKTVPFLSHIILLAGSPYHEITATVFVAYSHRIYKSHRSTSQNVLI